MCEALCLLLFFFILSRGHATLHPAVSVGLSVPPSVLNIFFISVVFVFFIVLYVIAIARYISVKYCCTVVLEYCLCPTVSDFCPVLSCCFLFCFVAFS